MVPALTQGLKWCSAVECLSWRRLDRYFSHLLQESQQRCQNVFPLVQEMLGLKVSTSGVFQESDKSSKLQSRLPWPDVGEEGQAFYSQAPLDCPNLDRRALRHKLSHKLSYLNGHAHKCAHTPSCTSTHTAWTSPCEDAAVVWYAMLIAVLVCLSRENPQLWRSWALRHGRCKRAPHFHFQEKSCETASTSPYIAFWKPQRCTLCCFIQFGWK